MLELALAVLLGVLCGIVTGLIPGVHINLVSLLLVSSSPFLLQYFSLLSLACFVIAMSVVHTFLDSIPGIFLGAPESDTALGVLPGHRYLLRGNGLMALKLTLIGSYGAILLSVLLFPLFLILAKHGYPLLSDYIPYFLILIVIFMILTDRRKVWAFTTFFLSGTLGYIVLNFPGLENPLLPMLSGLFGFSTLLISLDRDEKIPKQKFLDYTDWDIGKGMKALFSGQASGFLTSVFPGVGASTAAVISVQFARKLGDHGFMILLGSVNTVNFVLSLATFHVLEKARNGSVIAVQKLMGSVGLIEILVFLSVALIAGSVSVYLALWLGKVFVEFVNRVSYPKLVLAILLLLTILTFVLSGWLGLLILVISTAVGIVPAISRVKRTHSMGCLMLPVILYFLL